MAVAIESSWLSKHSSSLSHTVLNLVYGGKSAYLLFSRELYGDVSPTMYVTTARSQVDSILFIKSNITNHNLPQWALLLWRLEQVKTGSRGKHPAGLCSKLKNLPTSTSKADSLTRGLLFTPHSNRNATTTRACPTSSCQTVLLRSFHEEANRQSKSFQRISTSLTSESCC